MNFYLISNMCASVHADFGRPKGLESAQPGLTPTQYGTIEVAIKLLVYGKNSVLFSVWKDDPCHIELLHPHINCVKTQFTLAVLNVLKIYSHWRCRTKATMQSY